MSTTTALSLTELMPAIIRDPLVISPEASVMDAVVQMNNAYSCCEPTQYQLGDVDPEARSSCVVVEDQGQVVGILTERDIVRLSAQHQSLHDITVGQVMPHFVATLHESALTSISSVLALLQQCGIRHLPILDEQERLVGIVTRDSLQQAIAHHHLEGEETGPDRGQQPQTVAEPEGPAAGVSPVDAASDRQAIEVLLRQQQAAIEAAIDGIAILQGDTYLYLNQSHLKLLGYERPQDMVGKTWRMLYSQSEVERFERDVFPLLERDRTWQGEAIATRQDGSTVAQGVSLTLTDDGLLIWVCHDISERARLEAERQQAEAALQISEERLQFLINSLPFGVWVRDADDRLILQNHEDAARYGYLIGTRLDETEVAKERIDRYYEVKQSCQYGEPIQYETTETVQNEERHYLRLAAPLPDINGEVGVFGVAIDITDRKQAELALQRSERRFRNLFESTPNIAVQGYDRQRQVIYWNQASEDLYGYPEAEALGRQLEDLIIPPEMRQGVIEAVEAWVNDGQPIPASELSLMHKDGSRVAVFSSHIMLINAAGEPEMYCVDVNLSELKQAEEALQNLVEGTAATTGRDFFPALVSHIATALDVSHAVVTEHVDGTLHTLAFWANGQLQPPFSYLPLRTPCERTLRDGRFYCESSLQQNFPDHRELVEMGVQSYLGIALRDTQGNAIGNLCILNAQPIQNPQRAEQLLRVFAARATAELERQRARTQLEQLNQELEAIVAERTAALQASEAQIRAMFEAIPDLLLRVTRDGTCLDCIQPRHHSGEFLPIQDHLSDVLPPDLLQQQLDRIDRAIATGTLQVYEHQFQKGDRMVYEEVRIDAISADEVLIIVRDISDRKQAEEHLRQLTARFNLAVESAGIGIWDWDIVQDSLVWDDRMYDLYGIEPERFGSAYEAWLNGLHPDDRANAETFSLQVRRGEREYDTEFRVVHPDGSIHYIKANAIVQRDRDGNAQRMIGINYDITDLKQNEIAMKRQLATIEAAVDGIAILEGDRYLYVNPSHLALFGYEHPDELIGQSWKRLYSPDEIERFEREILPMVQRDRAWQGEAIAIRKDGSTFAEGLSLTLTDDGLLICVCRDISDRKAAEKALTITQAAVDVAAEGVFWVRPDATFDYANQAACTMLGYTQDELSVLSVLDINPNFSLERWHRHWQEVRQRKTFTMETQHQAKDGHIYPVEISINYLELDGEEYDFAFVRDISDRKHAETQVRSLLNRTQLLNRISSEIRDSLDLDIILQNSVNAIFAGLPIDSCTFAWYQNDSDPPLWIMVKEQKKPSLPSWLGSYQVDEFPHLFEHIVQNRLYRVDDRESLEDGPLKAFFETMGVSTYLCLPIHTLGQKIGSLQIGRVSRERTWLDEEIELLQDISNQVAIAIYQAQLYEESQIKTQELQRSYQELKDTQLQLIQSEKMSSLGQLVAGIAHEINNPVSFIYGNLTPALSYAQNLEQLISLYQDAYPNPPEAIADFIETVDIDYILSDFPKLLASMENGAVRIQDLVKSLRTFSRLDQAACKTINLHENIDSTLIILQNRLNGRAGNPEIQVVKCYGDLPPIECYSSLLNQVFMNLVVNAIDAIEERQVDAEPDYSGYITITTESLPDNRIRITIQDNGIGMSPETQAKIFNPFFTTKPTGVGTGLGLSISYQIVTGNHQGQIYCSSVYGEGTTFTLELRQLIPSPALRT